MANTKPIMVASSDNNEAGEVPLPGASSVEVLDEMSVDGVYRRYGQRRYSAEPPPAVRDFGRVKMVADPADPDFDLEKMVRAIADMRRDQGWEFPKQTITFQDLAVTVKQKETHIPTISSTLYHLFKRPYSALTEPTPMYTKLSGINGYCRPGEMLLVMGPPGSGCSTLLKVLSGRRKDYQVSGSVLYNGSPEYDKLHITLIGEEDNHLPSLTVEQTLMFAADMLVPLEYPDRANLKRDVQNALHLLGLYRVKDTVVGDGMLRGISGGEKKRVTLGELAISRASVLCFDGWSKGLDAAAAIDLCKTARVLANTMKSTIIMSQYQASAEMFDIFDNVLLLDGGRQIYFGPVREAVQYFEHVGLRCPPRRTIPDYLATLVDHAAELAAPGQRPPLTREAFAAAFLRSAAGQAIQAEIQASARQAFQCPPMSASALAALNAKYATPFRYQMRQLIKREGVLTRNSVTQSVIPRFMQNIAMGVILGLLFYNLPLNRNGAYSRSGFLFQALNFVGFSSFAFMPALLLDRGVFYKQRDSKLFHPMAWFLSKTVSDLPFTVLETVFFGAITYWMIGLYGGFGHFLFYLLVLWVTNVSMSNLIRVFTCMARDLNAVQGVAAAFMICFVFFSGFMIPKDNLPAVWKWAYWVSPLQYPLHALLVNEYAPLTFKCDPDELQPPAALLRMLGVNTSLADYQVCTIAGYPTGPRTGTGYLYAAFNIVDGESRMWADIFILLGFTGLFMLGAAAAVTYLTFTAETSHMRFKTRPAANNGSSYAAEGDSQAEVEERDAVTAARRQDFGGCKEAYLTWSHLSYEVPLPTQLGRRRRPETLQLLNDVHGYCAPRSMVALMGASGAGKTTLLDVLAMRKTGGRITGDIRVNGARQDETFKHVAGYVEQEDNHQPMCTVRESLIFAARLRLPADAGEDKIVATVESTLRMLGLQRIAEAMIGSDQTDGSIPLEARKRVTIAVELVANPSILFLDEPTSGLDTRGALIVMKAARRIADSGRTVICTIHQPSAELFEMFDRLLLLARGGRTVYFGPIGANSQLLLRYFESHGAAPCPPNYNPADYILDVIGSGIGRKTTNTDWGAVWAQSDEFKELYAQRDSVVPAGVVPFGAEQRYPSTWVQAKELIRRTGLVYWRTPSYNLIRHVFAIAVGLLLGSSYFQLGHSQSDLQQHVACLFFSIFLGALAMLNAMIPVFTERAVFLREVTNGSYRRRIYALASSVVEIPFVVVASVLFLNIFYWMVGMPAKLEIYIFAMLDYFVYQLFSVYLGQAIAAVAPTLQTAMGVAPVLMSIWLLHVGFLIPEPSIPVYFKVFSIVNPYKYFMRSFVASALHGQKFTCSPGQYLEFPKPPFGCPKAPVGQWVTGTVSCLLCPTIDGDAYLEFYGWKYSTRWTDLLILVVACGVFRLITTLAIAFRQYNTR